MSASPTWGAALISGVAHIAQLLSPRSSKRDQFVRNDNEAAQAQCSALEGALSPVIPALQDHDANDANVVDTYDSDEEEVIGEEDDESFAALMSKPAEHGSQGAEFASVWETLKKKGWRWTAEAT